MTERATITITSARASLRLEVPLPLSEAQWSEILGTLNVVLKPALLEQQETEGDQEPPGDES